MATMTLDDLVAALYPAHSRIKLTPEQKKILKHPGGPAWILAGPGSGKTEILALLALRLVYVERDEVQPERVPPEAIIVATFTERAARNLEDRISRLRARLIEHYPELAAIDLSRLRIGTLHGLCNDILQEYRAPNYQNVRLMDEMEQALLVHEHLSAAGHTIDGADRVFWHHLRFMVSGTAPNRAGGGRYPPNRWDRALALRTLLDRVTEARLDIQALRQAGGHLTRLADLADEYERVLQDQHRCDFAHLQLRFLEFLRGGIGRRFIYGDVAPHDATPGIRWVLVDEYQDTNLIQEEIYFELARRPPHNLVVVGDDDQAMYRFRGATVECMVTFDQACRAYWGLPGRSVKKYPLTDNFRSHPRIVDFFNSYITAFPSMRIAGARSPGKQPMTAKSGITGTHPAVGQLRAATLDELGDHFAKLIRGLLDNGIVEDLSQCCLLLPSTRETSRGAGPYVSALRARDLPYYNPRGKGFLEQEEIEALLGAIVTVVDPAALHQPHRPRALADLISRVRRRCEHLRQTHHELNRFLEACRESVRQKAGDYLAMTLQEFVYHVLAFSPFDRWQADVTRRLRLGKLTSLIESYSSTPVPGHRGLSRGLLRAAPDGSGGILDSWVRNFYFLFLGYLARQPLDEPEDQEVVVPPGMVPIMTIHQAKGLEFPFVFVGGLGTTATPGPTHQLDDILRGVPNIPGRHFPTLPIDTAAELDLIRQFYVAYSRAQYALILMGLERHFTKGAVPTGPNPAWLPNQVDPL